MSTRSAVSAVKFTTGTGRRAKRLAIIDGALTVFLTDGYAAASMDRVAEVAGVSKRTIYNHFGSKDDLFLEIVSAMVDEILEPIDRTLLRLATVEAILVDFAKRYAEVMLTENRIKLHRLVMAEIGRFPSIGSYYTKGYAKATAGVAQLLERLARRGMLSIADFEEAATCFWQLTISESHNELLFAPGRTKADIALDPRLTLGVTQFLRIYAGSSEPARSAGGA